MVNLEATFLELLLIVGTYWLKGHWAIWKTQVSSCCCVSKLKSSKCQGYKLLIMNELVRKTLKFRESCLLPSAGDEVGLVNVSRLIGWKVSNKIFSFSVLKRWEDHWKHLRWRGLCQELTAKSHYHCKAFHLRCFQRFWLRFWYRTVYL